MLHRLFNYVCSRLDAKIKSFNVRRNIKKGICEHEDKFAGVSFISMSDRVDSSFWEAVDHPHPAFKNRRVLRKQFSVQATCTKCGFAETRNGFDYKDIS